LKLIGFGEGMTSMSVPGLPNSLSDMRELQWHGKGFQLWLIAIRFLMFWKFKYNGQQGRLTQCRCANLRAAATHHNVFEGWKIPV
jgi:hypothetical protein